ncbi:MAG: membrane protein insertion efficiency factor YidD [Crocinitomicaceae bacterium]|nr:membrane protein insertion efficiency factor YidD [Crocinitomicaceae bacterium]
MKIYFIFTFLLIYSQCVYTQTINDQITSQLFNEYHYTPPQPRAKINFRNTTKLAKINFFKYLSSGLLYFYQNGISEQIQAECLYEISCSQFTKKMIEKEGLILGTFLGFHQLNNCQGNAILDYPTFKISDSDKIINRSYFE